jgi:hypothetical protein
MIVLVKFIFAVTCISEFLYNQVVISLLLCYHSQKSNAVMEVVR